jgi:hypothetical protein
MYEIRAFRVVLVQDERSSRRRVDVKEEFEWR